MGFPPPVDLATLKSLASKPLHDVMGVVWGRNKAGDLGAKVTFFDRPMYRDCAGWRGPRPCWQKRGRPPTPRRGTSSWQPGNGCRGPYGGSGGGGRSRGELGTRSSYSPGFALHWPSTGGPVRSQIEATLVGKVGQKAVGNPLVLALLVAHVELEMAMAPGMRRPSTVWQAACIAKLGAANWPVAAMPHNELL